MTIQRLAPDVVRVRADVDLVVRLDVGRPEIEGAVLAARAGVGPTVVEEGPHHLVVAYVEGRPLSRDDLGDDAVLGRVVSAVRALHTGARSSYAVDLLGATTYPDGIVAALRAAPEPTVLCHGDLTPANLVDDGERVWLIDLEYAGTNEPGADLGGLAAGGEMDAAGAARLAQLYYAPASARQVARVRLWQLVAQLLWSDWLRGRGGPGDEQWADRLAEQARVIMDADDFGRLLEEAGSA
ncbi:phosphotransferase [Nocardioides montaniterrae]